jgi:FMNH2-dependent dimethyl sulfone monooxygenase
MRYGYWLPVFGGWLRNVENENMEVSWPYVKRLAKRSEQIGFDLTLIAELNLNDIKGVEAPSLDAWSTAAALAAVTERIELMVAVRPTFHLPALLAKQAANIDQISNGRLTLNVVSSWWADEARKYGVAFEQHDDRYARTSEWLDVLDGVWKQDHFSYSGKYYRVEDNVLEPKPASKPRPTLYAGGESPAAKELIAEKCDAYLMHGSAQTPRTSQFAAAQVRRRRICDCAWNGKRSSGGSAPHHRCAPIRRWLWELPAVACGNATGAARIPGRLFGFESRPALRPDWHAGTGVRAPGAIRKCWC